MPTNSMEEPIRAEREKSQVALVRFLTTDLKLAYTFLGIAQIDSDPYQSWSAIAKARDALETIRGFQVHVEDPVASENIRSKADALENALKAFAV
jgi:hypothetical protein